jgi:hypothetical protein
MTITVLFAALWAAASNAPQQVLLFSSDAIAVARDAATEWNGGPLPKNAAFDIPDGPTKIQPGYFEVHYYIGTHIQLTVWINVTTGQVVEPDRCVYFYGQKIQAFSSSIRGKTGARPIPTTRLANSIGCDSLKPA